MVPFPAGKSGGRPLAAAQPAAAPGPADDTAFADWQLLFAAVQDRLRALAAGPPPAKDMRRVQADVLDCVGALDKLQTMAVAEMGRWRQPERDLAQAEGASAPVPNHLADSLAGASAAGGAKLALVYLDINDFKPINDAYGHSIGDEVLRVVALRLARSVRSNGLQGRLGGEQFACLLNNAPGRRQLGLLASKLGDAAGAPLTIGTLELAVSVSIGIATATPHGNAAGRLLMNAGLAMDPARLHRIGHAVADDANAAAKAARS